MLENEEDEDIKANRLRCVEILLENGADCNIKTKKLSMTAMHWAAYNNDAKVIKLLIANGAKQIFNKENQTPADIAGLMGNVDALRAICKNLAHQFVGKDQSTLAGRVASLALYRRASTRHVRKMNIDEEFGNDI